eukprot:TRINITY_DN77641_c0_g1_i1.p1 TRINITY_DN77641_c0_g1~~TRINITY_DN77641_c0_g1_i1.p1  ORF type:complete len:185 (-),score=14.46 TRINITY_DN77641_c0_g1_i1:49-561(-)
MVGLTVAALLFTFGLPKLHGAHVTAFKKGGGKQITLLCWLHACGYTSAVSLVCSAIFDVHGWLILHSTFAALFFLTGFLWHATLTFLHDTLWHASRCQTRRHVLKIGVLITLLASTVIVAACLAFGKSVFVGLVLPIHEWVCIIVLFGGFVLHGLDLHDIETCRWVVPSE